MLRCKLLLIFLPTYFMGCAALYVPDSRNTMIIEEAGEVQADVNVGSSGVEVKAAYSITDFLGIGYAGSFLNRRNDAVYFKPHDHSYNELMGMVNIVKFAGVGMLNFTAGAGSGTSAGYNSRESYRVEDQTVEGKFHRYYVQPMIAIKHEKVTYGLAGRFSYINFHQFSASTSRKRNSLDGYYFEPVIFIRSGGELVRVVSQFGFSSGMDDSSENAFNYEIYHISAGIHLNLSGIFRKYELNDR